MPIVGWRRLHMSARRLCVGNDRFPLRSDAFVQDTVARGCAGGARPRLHSRSARGPVLAVGLSVRTGVGKFPVAALSVRSREVT